MRRDDCHILIDGLPLCHSEAPIARMFACGYQWPISAEQAADKLRRALPTANIQVIAGKCPHEMNKQNR